MEDCAACTRQLYKSCEQGNLSYLQEWFAKHNYEFSTPNTCNCFLHKRYLFRVRIDHAVFLALEHHHTHLIKWLFEKKFINVWTLFKMEKQVCYLIHYIVAKTCHTDLVKMFFSARDPEHPIDETRMDVSCSDTETHIKKMTDWFDRALSVASMSCNLCMIRYFITEYKLVKFQHFSNILVNVFHTQPQQQQNSNWLVPFDCFDIVQFNTHIVSVVRYVLSELMALKLKEGERWSLLTDILLELMKEFMEVYYMKWAHEWPSKTLSSSSSSSSATTTATTTWQMAWNNELFHGMVDAKMHHVGDPYLLEWIFQHLDLNSVDVSDISMDWKKNMILYGNLNIITCLVAHGIDLSSEITNAMFRHPSERREVLLLLLEQGRKNRCHHNRHDQIEILKNQKIDDHVLWVVAHFVQNESMTTDFMFLVLWYDRARWSTRMSIQINVEKQTEIKMRLLVSHMECVMQVANVLYKLSGLEDTASNDRKSDAQHNAIAMRPSDLQSDAQSHTPPVEHSLVFCVLCNIVCCQLQVDHVECTRITNKEKE